MAHEPPQSGHPDGRMAQRLADIERQLAQLEAARNPAAASMYRANAQNIGVGWKQILFDAITIGSSTYCDVTTNHAYIAPAKGIYSVMGQIGSNWGSPATIYETLVGIYVNGGEQIRGGRETTQYASGLANSFTDIVAGGLLSVNAGDRIELWGWAPVEVGLEIGFSNNRMSAWKIT